jgi:hypothetical protein
VPLTSTQLCPPVPRVQTGVAGDGAPGVLARPIARASPEDRIRATA